MEDNVYIKIIEEFSSNSSGFTFDDIKSSLGLKENETGIIKTHFLNAFRNGIIINGSTPNLETIFILKDNSNITAQYGFNITSFKPEKGELMNELLTFPTEITSKETALKTHISTEGYLQEKFILKYDAVFAYIDYQELKLARKNAKSAFWTSIGAIFLSLITLGISIYYSHIQISYSEKQLNNPIIISGSQIEELKSSNNAVVEQVNFINDNLNNTNQYLDDIDSKIMKLNNEIYVK